MENPEKDNMVENIKRLSKEYVAEKVEKIFKNQEMSRILEGEGFEYPNKTEKEQFGLLMKEAGLEHLAEKPVYFAEIYLPGEEKPKIIIFDKKDELDEWCKAFKPGLEEKGVIIKSGEGYREKPKEE